jgi:ribose 5-phosphate isomerase B
VVIIAVAGDHAGRPLLPRIVDALRAAGYETLAVGPTEEGPADDYPDIARAVGTAVLAGAAERGVIVCGSGAGVAVAATKMRGIRAAVAHDTYTAHQMVEHDDVNVLCLGGRVIGSEVAAELVTAFAGARFSGEERHLRRLAKVQQIEAAGA